MFLMKSKATSWMTLQKGINFLWSYGTIGMKRRSAIWGLILTSDHYGIPRCYEPRLGYTSVWKSLNIWSASLILPLCHRGTQRHRMVWRLYQSFQPQFDTSSSAGLWARKHVLIRIALLKNTFNLVSKWIDEKIIMYIEGVIQSGE